MALYLYCVTAADLAPEPALKGLGDEEVSRIAADGLGVWVSRAADDALDVSVAALEAHNRVIEAAMTEAVTPVPLRYGQRLPSVDAVRERISGERARWLELLALFAGAVEFGVRVLDPARSPSGSSIASTVAVGGRAYLEAVAKRQAGEQEQRHEAARIGTEVKRIIGGAALRDRVDPLRTPRGVASIAHLVKRATADEYHARIERLRESMPALRFLQSGPWPPYSFAA